MFNPDILFGQKETDLPPREPSHMVCPMMMGTHIALGSNTCIGDRCTAYRETSPHLIGTNYAIVWTCTICGTSFLREDKLDQVTKNQRDPVPVGDSI